MTPTAIIGADSSWPMVNRAEDETEMYLRFAKQLHGRTGAAIADQKQAGDQSRAIARLGGQRRRTYNREQSQALQAASYNWLGWRVSGPPCGKTMAQGASEIRPNNSR